jgi:uncharacterized damage-inducible protein DinB
MSELSALLAYHRWATLRILEAAQSLSQADYGRDLGSSHGGVHGTLLHLYGADAIWLARLRGEVPPAFPSAGQFPDLVTLEQQWPALWDSLDKQAQDEARHVTYARLDGTPQQSRACEILRHVVNHGTHHRGQLVTLLRQLGQAAPNTDLIAFYRQQALDRGPRAPGCGP